MVYSALNRGFSVSNTARLPNSQNQPDAFSLQTVPMFSGSGQLPCWILPSITPNYHRVRHLRYVILTKRFYNLPHWLQLLRSARKVKSQYPPKMINVNCLISYKRPLRLILLSGHNLAARTSFPCLILMTYLPPWPLGLGH